MQGALAVSGAVGLVAAVLVLVLMRPAAVPDVEAAERAVALEAASK